jgi:hypothetical protein
MRSIFANDSTDFISEINPKEDFVVVNGFKFLLKEILATLFLLLFLFWEGGENENSL